MDTEWNIYFGISLVFFALITLNLFEIIDGDWRMSGIFLILQFIFMMIGVYRLNG